MSTDRDEQVIAAYGAGEDIEHIKRRFGISSSDIHRIVAAGTGGRVQTGGKLPHTEPRQRLPLTVAGITLIVLGLVIPFGAGATWLAIYYLSETAYPISSWGYGNFVAGLSGICFGSAVALVGLILLLVNRGHRR